jgi:two-component system response regulator PrrA
MNIPCRVLLVEDQAALRATLTRALKLHGLDVEAVDGMASAKLHLEAAPVNILISDVSLAHAEDGFILARWTRLRWSRLPIILISGLALYDPPQELAADPYMKLLPKPFAVGRLIGVCREMWPQNEAI